MKDKKGINKGEYHEESRRQGFIQKWHEEYKEIEKFFYPQKAHDNPSLSRLGDFRLILFEKLDRLDSLIGVYGKILGSMSEYLLKSSKVEKEDLEELKEVKKLAQLLNFKRKEILEINTIRSFIELVIEEAKNSEIEKAGIENTYVIDKNGEIIRKKKRQTKSIKKEVIQDYINHNPEIWERHLEGIIANQEMLKKIKDFSSEDLTLRTFQKWKAHFRFNQ